MEEEKSEEWLTTTNRFVAFFDILGFKDLVARKSHEEIHELLTKISDIQEILTKKIYKTDGNISIANFSDSIIIFSKDDSTATFFFDFLFTISYLFAKAIEYTIPLKGAIALGQISVDKKKQLYFGQPIIDAYLLEEELNYLGIIAHNSIDNYINSDEQRKALFNIDLSTLFETSTPLKSGKISHINVNWFSMIGILETKDLKSIDFNLALNKIKNLKCNISGPPRKYIDNTLDVLENLKERIETLSKEENHMRDLV